MDLEQAKSILSYCIKPDGGLFCLGHYLSWEPGSQNIVLDDTFDFEELEAIVVYVKSLR
jgi:hypothetical protein